MEVALSPSDSILVSSQHPEVLGVVEEGVEPPDQISPSWSASFGTTTDLPSSIQIGHAEQPLDRGVEPVAVISSVTSAPSKRGSPQSSSCSLPAVGRLCELVDEKAREVSDLEARCEQSTSSEERAKLEPDLAAAREELRLLKEFLGEVATK